MVGGIILPHPLQDVSELFSGATGQHAGTISSFRCPASRNICRVSSDCSESAGAGRLHDGSKALLEAIRSHRMLSGKRETELFNINKTSASRYTRRLMEEDHRFSVFLHSVSCVAPDTFQSQTPIKGSHCPKIAGERSHKNRPGADRLFSTTWR